MIYGLPMSGLPVCAVVGIGPGNGAAFARRFSSDGYAVALLTRNPRALARARGRRDNRAAIACYDRLGLATVAQYEERMLYELSPRAC